MTERIRVINEQGSPDVVYKIVDSIDTSTLDGPSSVKGLAKYRLASTGEHLNIKDDNTFTSADGRRSFHKVA